MVTGSVTRDEVTWRSDKGVTDLGFAGSICWPKVSLFSILHSFIL